jgi:hypothetical protein
MRREQAEALVQAMRAASVARQAEVLTRRLEALDDARTRQAAYALLTEDELALLLPGVGDYVRSLSNAELAAIQADDRLARRAVTQLQRQHRQGGGGHAET